MSTPNPTTQASNNLYDDNLDDILIKTVSQDTVKTNYDKSNNDPKPYKKKTKTYTILQMNKGTADFQTKQDLVKSNIKDNAADITVITEANYEPNDPSKVADAKKTLKGYKIEISTQPNNPKSRCIMIIKNTVQYERLDVDDDENPIVAISIKTKKHQKAVIVGHYRQWRMPGEGPPNDKDGIKRQKIRLEKFSKTIDHLQALGSHLILLGDYNIDQWAENEPWLRPEIRALQPILDRIISNNGLTRMNKIPTRHAAHNNSSLLDLILANDPTNIKKIKNIKTGLSDHDGLSFELTCTDVDMQPQFFIHRDFSQLTSSNIMPLVDNDMELQSIFSETDVNIIAQRLNHGLNEIAKKLIIKRRIQNNKKSEDFDDKELRARRKTIKQQSTIAHESKDINEHRLLKNLKNQYTKIQNKKKKEYETKILKGIKSKWKFINENDVCKTPVYVKINGKYSSNQRLIAEKYSEHLIDKIDSLTNSLPDKRNEAMKVYTKLVERVEEDCVLKEITYKKVYKTIMKLKKTNSRGENEITNRYLKEIPQFISLAILHLYNNIIRSGKYPDEFKLSRIIPLIKKKKDKGNIDSYRPINNVNPIAKCIEGLLKEQFDEFFDTNKVFPPTHHGSRKSHSTTTASMVIQHALNSNQDKQKFSAVLLTDLSSAFDTCDHRLLLHKAEHIGIRGNALAILTSYLADRKSYVEIQGYISTTKMIGDKSVIQGSKLASLNYNIYTLDAGKLDQLIHDKELTKTITDTELDTFEDTEQTAVSYVDDLSQILGHKNEMILQSYIQTTYEVSVKYFQMNLLSINSDKTELMVIPPRGVTPPKMYILTDAGDFIVSASQVKILGVIFNNQNNMQSHASALASKIGLTYRKLKPYIQHAPPAQRKVILMSKLESIALYGAPLFFNETLYCRKRLEDLLMNIYKWIYMKNTYMVRYSKICQDIKVEEPDTKILNNNTKFICKLMHDKKVKQILDFLIVNVRTGSQVYMADPQKNSSKSAIIKLIRLYNALPLEIKLLSPQRLKRKLLKWKVTFKE